MKTQILILAAALLTPPATAKTIKASYRCDDGSRWTATFHNPPQGLGSVTLNNKKNGKTLVLPQKRSADGGRYASGNKEFWIKGNKAIFTRGSKDATCRTNS